jgi:DNA-binding NtrC family response regulator
MLTVASTPNPIIAQLPPPSLPSKAMLAPDTPPTVIADSQAMRAVLEKARQFAATDLPVLITGEIGTGKSMLARFIHDRSRRRGSAFVSKHCGTIPASLTDTELFGHGRTLVPGAGLKRGLLERAHGGTIFLDEVSELPISAQTGLLHLLHTREIVRIGERVPIQVDLRLITGITLSESERPVSTSLRPDLYYRLSVLRLHLPPLRQRIEDIGLLAQLFLDQIGTRLQGQRYAFAPEAIARLKAHSWPGNVRELIGVVQRAAIRSRGDQIGPMEIDIEDPAPATPTAPTMDAPSRPPPGSSAELSMMLEALERTRFNITRAASELKVSRVTFYRMLKRNKVELRQDWVLGHPKQDGT